MAKLFLIDDDADDREYFCEALEEIYAEVLYDTAPDGRRGLAN